MRTEASVAGRIVRAARSCTGARFRPQGRDPAIGLDCIGLAAFAYRAADARPVLPSGYTLRGGDVRSAHDWLMASGFHRIADAAARVGDLLLLRPGARQLHLAVHSGTGFIHADLGLRRVVETPGAPGWPILSVWRWRPDPREEEV
ncbi:MAG: peptidoglycan endopeptidase [Pseudomonadota bacterium]